MKNKFNCDKMRNLGVMVFLTYKNVTVGILFENVFKNVKTCPQIFLENFENNYAYSFMFNKYVIKAGHVLEVCMGPDLVRGP